MVFLSLPDSVETLTLLKSATMLSRRTPIRLPLLILSLRSTLYGPKMWRGKTMSLDQLKVSLHALRKGLYQ